MTKLKTLKDFGKDWKGKIFEDEVREEAIKWVCEFERQKGLIDSEAGEYSKKRLLVLEGKITTFKNFFNITEDDLK